MAAAVQAGRWQLDAGQTLKWPKQQAHQPHGHSSHQCYSPTAGVPLAVAHKAVDTAGQPAEALPGASLKSSLHVAAAPHGQPLPVLPSALERQVGRLRAQEGDQAPPSPLEGRQWL